MGAERERECKRERREREGEGEEGIEQGGEGGREEEDKYVYIWTSFTLFHT